MKTEIKIGIVEDELLIAEKIKMLLTDIGYKVCEPVSSFEEALVMIKNETPDFLLLDINLGKEKDGIHIAEKINEMFFLPFIFLTANSDALTIERAKAVKPFAYLVKPFTKEELFTSIEIALNNFNTLRPTSKEIQESASANSQFFIRQNHRFIKIPIANIAYIESLENYVIIHSVDKKNYMFRSTFASLLKQLPIESFFQVHRSYAIRTELIDDIENTQVTVAGYKVPLSITYRDSLFKQLGIK